MLNSILSKMRNDEDTAGYGTRAPLCPQQRPSRTNVAGETTGPSAVIYDPSVDRGAHTNFNSGQKQCRKGRATKANKSARGGSSYYRYKAAPQKGFYHDTRSTHKVMTPAYAPNSNSASRPPAYSAQSRNAATRSVVYTPYYNYEQQYQFQAGVWKNGGSPSNQFLITSPTSPEYSPTSPKYKPSSPTYATSSPYHQDADIFSPCYKPEGTIHTDKDQAASNAHDHKEIPDNQTSNRKLLLSTLHPKSCKSNNSSRSSTSFLIRDIIIEKERKDLITDNVGSEKCNTKSTKVQGSGCRHLTYDPLQPQYSPTYDPDPFHLLNDEEYNPLFPALND